MEMPILLLKAGLLIDKQYIAGIIKSELMEEGFTEDDLKGLRDINELKNPDGTYLTCLVDGQLITAVGCAFVEFGVTFGKQLGLDFSSEWYHSKGVI